LPRVEVQLFGSFVLHVDGQLVDNPSRKVDRPRELAAILILHPKGLPDETIAELMFPDMKPQRALHNLQMAASSLRKQFGAKAAVRLSAKTYQLSPQLELIADVRDFDAALSRARGGTGEAYVQALGRAVDLYRGPLLADVAWGWLEPVCMEYRSRFVSAALQLADALAPIDPARSDQVAEKLLSIAPDTDLAYERLLQNARQRHDRTSMRHLLKRYSDAASLFGFRVNPHLTDDGASGGRAAAR
jgi:DNA-binding SARP family transcriptional activator